MKTPSIKRLMRRQYALTKHLNILIKSKKVLKDFKNKGISKN